MKLIELPVRCVLRVAVVVSILAFSAGCNGDSAGQPSQGASAAASGQSSGATSITFTSDPSGAWVFVDDVFHGETPLTIDLPRGRRVNYLLKASEPYQEYKLYKPFSGVLVAAEDKAISVWLDRTTIEEQEAQRLAFARERESAERRRLEAAVRASPWVLRRQIDSITDEDRSYILSPAIRYPSPLNDDAYLMIRCSSTDPTASDGIVLIINADDYLGSRDLPVDWRFDDRSAVLRQQWRASTKGTAVFNLSYKTQFIIQMLGAETLTARLYDYRGVGNDYVFRVDGTREALSLLGCYRGSALR